MDELNKLIVSSRVRIARNIEGLPFKTRQRNVFDGISDTIKRKNRAFVSTPVSELDPGMAKALFEQHLISRELLNNKINSVIVASTDNKVVVMLGEEDHIRIQSIQTGYSLYPAFESAKKIANDIEAEHDTAYRDDFGYLTSCPTNIGTGMRASVMMFLPALTITEQIDSTIERLLVNYSNHITVRGMYGEGSEAGGYMYQISNQSCFGMREEQILKMVETVTLQIARDELKAQAAILKSSSDKLADRVMRSWGILTNALMLSSAESVEHLAVLKLGACLDIIKFKNVRVLDDLFFVLQPNTLVAVDERAADTDTRDKLRAKRAKEILLASRVK